MAQVIDVGQWIYNTCGARTGNLRSTKLAYFGQVWSLAWTGRQLFDSPIEAWPAGPVVAELWRAEKYDLERPGRIAGADAGRVSEREAAILNSVVRFYHPMTTERIKALSHDIVWEHAREGYGPQDRSTVELNADLMLRHYSRLSLVGEAVPSAPAGVACDLYTDERVLSVSRGQRDRWARVHERLASA